MRYLPAILLVMLAVLIVPARADLGLSMGTFVGASAPATAPASSTTLDDAFISINHPRIPLGTKVQVKDVSAIGRDLSTMIHSSGPWDNKNPTERQGECSMKLPYTINNLHIAFQKGTYKAGVYAGHLPKGEYVFLWEIGICDGYRIFRISRAQCGNPERRAVFFGIPVPKQVANQPPLILSTTSTTVETSKVPPGLLSFAQQRLVPDQLPTTTLGPLTEARLLLAWVCNVCGSRERTCGHYPGGSENIPEPPVPCD